MQSSCFGTDRPTHFQVGQRRGSGDSPPRNRAAGERPGDICGDPRCDRPRCPAPVTSVQQVERLVLRIRAEDQVRPFPTIGVEPTTKPSSRPSRSISVPHLGETSIPTLDRARRPRTWAVAMRWSSATKRFARLRSPCEFGSHGDPFGESLAAVRPGGSASPRSCGTVVGNIVRSRIVRRRARCPFSPTRQRVALRRHSASTPNGRSQ